MVFKNILNFPFNIFVQLLQNLKILPNTSANKLLNLNQDHPSKKQSLIVKVNSRTALTGLKLKMDVTKTSLIVMF